MWTKRVGSKLAPKHGGHDALLFNYEKLLLMSTYLFDSYFQFKMYDKEFPT